MPQPQSHTVGLGLRRDFIGEVLPSHKQHIDFFEIAPENYIGRGGRTVALFEKIAQDFPIVLHGLSLSIGSLDELNWNYLKKLKDFIRDFNIPWFSDHLCFSSTNAHVLHDLLPLPFTKEAVKHVSERARVVQDFLEVPFGLENVSFYLHPARPEMTELQFIQEILHQSGVSLMLDVNNVYVNSVNHGTDAKLMICELAKEKLIQLHIAGHDKSGELIIDTHGEDVCADVWDLLHLLGECRELPPLLIERDNKIPDMKGLLSEVERARIIVNVYKKTRMSA